MFRDAIGPDQGMLFIYHKDQFVSYLMKNVSFALDMIFLDHCGVVLSIAENLPAFDETIIRPEQKVRAVLELRAGASKRAKIGIGDRINLSGVTKVGHLLMQEQARITNNHLPCFYER